MQQPYAYGTPAAVEPGDPRTLGYGTDQGRWLQASIKKDGSAAPNPFRCAGTSDIASRMHFFCAVHVSLRVCSIV